MVQPSSTDAERPRQSGNRALGVLFVIGVLALIVSIVLPLVRDRELWCPQHLKQIGSALLLYAMENDHRYPPTLSPLFTGRNAVLNPKALKCPAAAGPDIASSYTYVGGGMTDREGNDTVVAYDANHMHDGFIYVLYGDGHVDGVERPDANYLIAEVTAGHNPPRPRNGPTSQPTTRPTGEEAAPTIQSPAENLGVRPQ